ncbi:MAG TPA: tRNA lysidine(34) synthetase TilS, partial [Methylomirabilota bacterium]|nr:tRNA lysidine(34) synthetase TilS [Methylomirabilota bacterium]
MRDLLAHVEQSIRRHCELADGQRILVAVSGGLDSQVLLHLLHRLAPARGWRLVVAHFHHGLRGRASDADEALVRRTAEQLRLPCLVGHGQVRKLADEEGLSVEMAARRLRHDFLARAALRRRCPVVALAHHADDQVELFFLRLLRGAGAEGLAGMGWTSPSPARPEVRLVRPLLDVPKSALRQFAELARLPFREDRSNASFEALRNRLRHEVLPLLKRTCQPALERVILRQMDILEAEARHLDAEARAWLERRRPSFDRLSTALQRHCLRLQLLALGARADFDWIEQLRETPQRAVTIRPGLVIAREPDGTLRARREVPGDSGP